MNLTRRTLAVYASKRIWVLSGQQHFYCAS